MSQLVARKWWNTETVFLQARVTADGITAFKRFRNACSDAYVAHERKAANGVKK